MRTRLAAAALGMAVAGCSAPGTNAPQVMAPPPPVLRPSAPQGVAPPATARAPATAAPAPPSPEGLTAWKRNHDGLDASASVQDCLGCHDGSTSSVHRGHPVDADYASAAGLADSSLRTPEEARRRGARLPGGKLHCLSCHDPGSPWKSHVALPAGARARAALVLGPDDGAGEQRASKAEAAPAPGSAVNSMALCQTCHTYGD